MSSADIAPEFIWRISKYDDLSGRGGLTVSGRWHTYPKSVIYCSTEPRTALLEMLRQYGDEDFFPDSLKLLKIQVPKRVRTVNVDIDSLDPSWSDDVLGPFICRPIGDDWLVSIRTAMMMVPSVTGPHRKNVLINSSHPDAAEFVVVEFFSIPFPDFVHD